MIVKSCSALIASFAWDALPALMLKLKLMVLSGGVNVWNLKFVTTPNEPPAPRRAQNRSGFWVFEAVTTVLLASTTVASTRLSSVNPYV